MRPRVSRWIVATSTTILAVFLADGKTQAQPAASSALSDLEAAVIRALALNPETAPYPIGTALVNGRLQLSGVVGTKHAHDSAIRTVMAFTPNIDDQLVIDTASTIQAAGGGMGPMSAYPRAGYPARPTLGNVPYTYPPPLFGYYDDPFYGFEPPILSYPPWWNAMSAARLTPRQDLMPPQTMAPPQAMAPPLSIAAPPVDTVAPPPSAPGPSAPADEDSFEMTIDAQGVATLTGQARNPAERAEIERRIARMPGVAGVINNLEIARPKAPENPPKPPEPPDPNQEAPQAQVPRLLNPESAARPAPRVVDNLAGRVRAAIARRPGLENAPVQVEDRNGSIALSGQLPNVYDAMLAFRAAEQTPGVKSVSDRLAFDVPRPGDPNPLIEKGSSEDVEPYLKAQIQRQVGESVHIDRVSAQGDDLEVLGTLSDSDDLSRVEAVLRSMPILRGYRLRPVFRVN